MAHTATYEHGSCYEELNLAGTVLTYRAEHVAYHGPDKEFVDPGRRVVTVPGRIWSAARPEDCPDNSITGIWFDDAGQAVSTLRSPEAAAGIVLLCSTCGLDCT